MTTPPKILVSAEHLEAYTRRKALVDAFAAWDGSLRSFAEHYNVPPSTVRDLVAKARQGSDNLLDRRMNGGRKVALPSIVVGWCFCFWADHPKASLMDIHREVSKMAEEANLSAFSYKQVKSLFSRIPEDMRKIVVDGARAGFERAGQVARRVQGFANEEWQMDATQLDQWALDMSSGVWYQPWMTTIIDGHSRIVMAAMFHRNEPTTADALIALQAAILPKGYVDYPFFGVPKAICTDNHSTYRSADFLDALRRLNITKIEIPNRCPSANGKIERWFHTFKYGLLAKLSGYAGQYKGLAKAQKSAVPESLLPKLIRKFMVEYHLREHSALGCTPWEKWHEDAASAHGLMVDETEIMDAIKLRRKFQVARDGILVEPGRHFTDPCIGGLVDEEIQVLLSPEGRDNEIPAYYNSKLIGQLYCVEEDSGLANEIRAERLLRSIDIQRLASSLRGIVENAGINDIPIEPSTPLPSTPLGSPENPIITGEAAKPYKVAPLDEWKPLGIIPVVKVDDEG